LLDRSAAVSSNPYGEFPFANSAAETLQATLYRAVET
jgi:hypothetical protein